MMTIDKHTLRRLNAEPPGPQRLQKRIRLLDRDLERVLALPDPPAAIGDLMAEYWAARTAAENVLDALDRADAAEEADRRSAITKVKDALLAGTTPKLPAAKDERRLALLSIEATEQLLIEAHAALIAAIRDQASVWRELLIDDARAAHEAFAKSARKAADMHGVAATTYEAVTVLDSEMRGRFDDVKQACDTENVDGENWYAATHTGRRPLKFTAIPGQQDKGKSVAFVLADVLQGVVVSAEDAGAFPAAEWSLPGTPGHDDQVDHATTKAEA